MTCKKRNKDGSLCDLPDATYGVTIHSAFGNYTVMVCKKHWLEYLSNPHTFITTHETGAMQWLTDEVDSTC